MYGQYPGAGRRSNRQTFQNSDPTGSNDSDGEDCKPTGMGGEQPTYSDQDQINPQSAPQTSQEPQYSGAYVVFPPNEAKREKLLRISSKELEEYERMKEARRPGPVNLTPIKLGGRTAESDVRLQQQQMQAQSKYQKMHQRDEYKRKLKEEEEAKIQQKKDIQRQKAEKLEEKRRQQDKERRERWHESRSITNNQFLDQLSQMENNSGSHSSIEKTPSAWVDEDDEDHILQQVLEQSKQMYMAEEEERRQRMKEEQHTQPMQQTYIQQQKEQEEKQLKRTLKEQQCRKLTQQTYRQQQKEEEERRIAQNKEEQRRKSELLEQKEDTRRQSQQEEHRRVNRAFLDRLQRQNTSEQEYSGVSNTWT